MRQILRRKGISNTESSPLREIPPVWPGREVKAINDKPVWYRRWPWKNIQLGLSQQETTISGETNNKINPVYPRKVYDNLRRVRGAHMCCLEQDRHSRHVINDNPYDKLTLLASGKTRMKSWRRNLSIFTILNLCFEALRISDKLLVSPLEVHPDINGTFFQLFKRADNATCNGGEPEKSSETR